MLMRMAEGEIRYLAGNNIDCEMVINGKWERATLAVNPVGAPGSGILNNVSNVISENPTVEHFMFQELNDVVILNNPVKGSTQLTLAPGHGFIPPVAPNRGYLNIHYNDIDIPSFVGTRFSQFAVTGVVGDVIDITPPLPYDYVTGKQERVKNVNINMVVDGSVTPVKFESFPVNGQFWDIHRIIGDMILVSAGDDGKFGNLPQLTRGQYFGFESDAYTEYKLAIFDNGDYRASAYDVTYPIRSGGQGDFGMSFRKTVTRTGSVVALRGNLEKFVTNIQDNLTTAGSIKRYRVKVGGVISKDRS